MVSYEFLPVVTTVIILYFARDTAGQDYFPNVTYDDLVRMNSACGDYHSCQKQRYYDDIGYNCNCADFCSQFDTCCVDSEHRDPYPIERKPYSCVRNYGKAPNRLYYMVDTCDPKWDGDAETKKFCEGNAEELDDIFLVVPVTNSVSRITYRNHHCAVCNNDTDDEHLVSWTLWTSSNSKEFNETEFAEIHFNATMRAWTYVNETSGEISLVSASIRPDYTVFDVVYRCIPRIVSKCAEGWNDTEVEDKCKAYMAIKFMIPETGPLEVYRNPHCALCNHVDLSKLLCTWEFRNAEQDPSSNTFFVRLFSLYDKTSKCDDSMVYDTLAKKCRKVYKG